MINQFLFTVLDPSSAIRQAMEILNKDNRSRTVLVADSNMRLLGTVTDGDIRRALLKGHTLDENILVASNKDPIWAHQNLTKENLKDLMRNHSILAIPILNNSREIVGIETIDSLESHPEIDNWVILMAGGFGTRLLPLTKDTPKPMLPLGDKPILEHIIDDLAAQGFKNFCITTHYKSDIIRNYFSKKSGINIEFVVEDEPLGTAGALFFLKNSIDSDFIVMNGDLLLKINFGNLLSFHKDHKSMATICVKEYTFQVPYGVAQLEGTNVSELLEKPSYTYLVNAGAYCFKPDILKYFEKKQRIDMTTLLQKVMRDNIVSAFPIHEYWADVGTLQTLDVVRKDFIF